MTDFFNQTVDTEGVDSESVHEGGGGNTVAEEGRYHVQVESVEIFDADPNQHRLPNVKLTMRVLAGEAESEVGKVVYNRLYLAKWNKGRTDMETLPENALKGLLALLHSFGVVGDEAFGQESFRLNRQMFENLEATQSIIKVTKGKDRTVTDKETGEKKTYAGRYEMAWSNDCWPLTHEKVADVPKDTESAAVAVAAVEDADDLSDL